MKLPPFQVRGKDLPADFQRSFNQFSDKLSTGLANGLTLAENFNAAFLGFSIPGGVPAAEYVLTHDLAGRCTGLQVWNVVASTTGRGVTQGAVTAQWKDNGDGTITVSSITGLTAGPDYAVVLLAFAEPI